MQLHIWALQTDCSSMLQGGMCCGPLPALETDTQTDRKQWSYGQPAATGMLKMRPWELSRGTVIFSGRCPLGKLPPRVSAWQTSKCPLKPWGKQGSTTEVCSFNLYHRMHEWCYWGDVLPEIASLDSGSANLLINRKGYSGWQYGAALYSLALHQGCRHFDQKHNITRLSEFTGCRRRRMKWAFNSCSI